MEIHFYVIESKITKLIVFCLIFFLRFSVAYVKLYYYTIDIYKFHLNMWNLKTTASVIFLRYSTFVN